MIDGEDRERNVSPRRAAETLFAPKREAHTQPGSDSGQSGAARKPRVLPVLPPAAIRPDTVAAPTPSTSQPSVEIPSRKSARLRSLVKFGMTVSQVAEVYGVPVETIEQLLRYP